MRAGEDDEREGEEERVDRDERDVPGQGEVTRGEGCALLAEGRPSGFLYVVEHPVVARVGLKSVVAVGGQFGQDSDSFLFRRDRKQPIPSGETAGTIRRRPHTHPLLRKAQQIQERTVQTRNRVSKQYPTG